MHCFPRLIAAVAIVASLAAPTFAQPGVPDQIREAEKLMASGDLAGATRQLESIVSGAPASFDARLILGRALDLQGQHDAARVHLEHALKLAKEDERNTALTSLGVSYAFEAKADEAARYYQRAFDARVQADDRSAAAGQANALARIYLESGNVPKAEEWYRTGHETAKTISGLTAPQIALWDMRWHHAQGRIAARRGDRKAAEAQAVMVKALLDKGGNENQRPILPYLRGYIAFFSKDYAQAIDELMQGDQQDPFILGLIAQSHETLGRKEAAAEYYRKVMASTAHGINSAFARPRARTFLR